MKRGARWVGLALLALVGLLCLNAMRRSPQPRNHAAPKPGKGPAAQVIAEHLAQAVRIPTISHEDPKLDDRTQFAAFRAFLERTYPLAHARMQRELISGDALLYRWQGSDPGAAPILFLAHQDVVPIEPGTESKWTHPAFDGVIADGYVWGRGSIDDKASLIGLFEASESLLQEGFTPKRTIYLASGFDEEIGGRQGALQIARTLKARGIRLAFMVDEGGAVTQGVLPEVERPVASIAVSEKGYLSLELVAHAEGGHSSMPPADNAIVRLGEAVKRVQQNQLAPRLLPIWRQNLSTVAPESSLLARVLLSNLWLTEPIITRMMASRKETNPLVRTTTAPTIFEAGVKDNVVPTSARAVINFRVLPGDSTATVLAHVREVVDDPSVEVKRLDRTFSEPSPIASVDGEGFRLLAKVARRYFPDAVVVPGVVSGATDARHFREVTDNAYRFVPRMFFKTDLGRVHGIDERMAVKDLPILVWAYRDLLSEGGSPR